MISQDLRRRWVYNILKDILFMDDDTKSGETCRACDCPCDEHKDHTHDDTKTPDCVACSCPCDLHKDHDHA